jgi:uncharacterized protein
MSRYDDLQRLQQLKEQGALTEDEFQREKQRLLDTPEGMSPPPPPPGLTGQSYPSSNNPNSLTSPTGPWGLRVPVYCMLLHLSQFTGYAVPIAGFALPIVMWAVNKDAYPEVDAHGKVILNWMISVLIYGAVFFILSFVLIGIPLLVALGLCGIIFPIIAAIKSNEGVVWKYPLSIKFF